MDWWIESWHSTLQQSRQSVLLTHHKQAGPFTLTNTPNTLSFHVSNHPCPAREAGWQWRAKSNHANKMCGWLTLHWQENYGCRQELEKTATFINRSEPYGCTCQKKKQWGGSLSKKNMPKDSIQKLTKRKWGMNRFIFFYFSGKNSWISPSTVQVLTKKIRRVT